MDISSSTASTTSSSTATMENTQSSSAQKSQQSDKSFKDELQKASKDNSETKAAEKTAETNSDKITDNKNDNKLNSDKKSESEYNALDQNLLLSGEINMAILGNQNILSINNTFNSEINNLQQLIENNVKQTSAIMSDDNAPTKVDYSIMQMSSDDAQFFADLVQDTDKTLQNVVTDLQSGIEQNIQKANKSVNVSATLMNAIAETVKTNQPFRIDFDKDVSIIIKVDKDGAVSAKFIPGDKAVEEYLRQNISSLKQRFDEQELSYRDLSYSQHRQQQNNRRNNKENEHE